MATNPYFNFYNRNSEQVLQEDLIIESIRIYGQDMVYIARDSWTDNDTIYGENPLSYFERTYEMEMYIKSVDDFGGDGDLFSKFGVEIRDQATLVVAMSRFIEATDQDFERPQEGDLIFLPLSGGIFEIHHVEDESIFYQQGSLFVFELTVEQFEYSHEDFKTGYDQIDQIDDVAEEENIHTKTLHLGSGTGDFAPNEIVYQGSGFNTADMTAVVHSYDAANNIIYLKQVTGPIELGVALQGTIDSASYPVNSIQELEIITDEHADNEELEAQSANIYDHTEKDPFSEGNF